MRNTKLNMSFIGSYGCFNNEIIFELSVQQEMNLQGLLMCLTDCADDASVARHSRFRVNVQQAHVLNEGVRHGSMHLLGVDDGRACIF